jgi:tungstate transport system permease protein
VRFLEQGLHRAWFLLTHWNHELTVVLETTARVAAWSTFWALLIGLPIALVLGLGRFPGRALLQALLNAGLGLPPVVVGLVLFLVLFRLGPLGQLHWVYTVKGMILAQTVLSLPIIASLSTSALQSVSRDLLEQARLLNASLFQVWRLALREARVGILAAVITAVGSALSEVGALILVGGNIKGSTETLATAVLFEVGTGDYGQALAIGVILLGIILILAGALTVAQQAGRR